MSGTFLDNLIAVKRERIVRQRIETDITRLRAAAYKRRATSDGQRLIDALNRKDRTNIIAEIKRASPSKGVINDQIDVAEMSRQYRNGGAAAISVLTEEDYFKGSLDDLIAVREAVDLPILRKDFIVDEFQVFESAAAGADVMLLIVAAQDEPQLSELYDLITDDLGMDAIVEVHTPFELETAARIGAKIIGVNNRDLQTLEVSLDFSRELIPFRPPGSLMIAESGISTIDEIGELKSLGYDGFLIGEELMKTGDPAALLGEWV